MTSQHDTESLELARQSSSYVPVATRINNKLDAISASPPKYTIFKVHELLRRENEMAYEPEILAIGPYHWGKGRLQVMEDRKLRWFKASLEELGESDATKYVQGMESLEPRARQCYSESTSDVNADQFVEMLLLDACFIIQFIRRCLNYDPIIQEEWVTLSSIRDILLFENQIPLFVLQELFSMIKLPREASNFLEFALSFMKGVFAMKFSSIIPCNTISYPSDVQHILGFFHDLCRSLAVPDGMNDPSINKTIKLCQAGFKFMNNGLINHFCGHGRFDQQDRRNIRDFDFLDVPARKINTEYIQSAAKLHAAGILFRSKKVRSSPFEVSFQNGIMEIPTLRIDDGTESLYRNLIAYEQYNAKASDRCIGMYAKLMDCLIDSAEDVALLRGCGILDNILGDDQIVSTIFNKLFNNVIVSNGDSKVYCKLFKMVNAYCGKRTHKWTAKLRRDYFNSPWALISFLAAFFLLMLTLTQTVFSILADL